MRSLNCLTGMLLAMLLALTVSCASRTKAVAAESTPKEAAAAPDTADATAEAEQPDEADAPEQPHKPEPPATVKVQTGRVAIEVDANGHFESAQMVEMVLRPKVWKEFEVLEAVAPGTQVKKGDTLVRLDTEKIDEAIAAMSTDAQMAALSLKQAEYELALMERTVPMDLQAADRKAAQSAEDRKHFHEVELPISKRGIELNLKSAQFALEYATEELTQLEKMYTADELVADTEEMILKRQRSAVERAAFALERAEIETQRALEVELPRRVEQVKLEGTRQEIAHEQAHTTLPIQLELKRLAMTKTRREHEKAAERRGQLADDRKLMDITAPVDGIVYYGRSDRGKFAATQAYMQKLREHGNIAPGEIFMTIVQPRPLQVRIDIPEAQIRFIKPGVKGTATTTAYPDVKFNVVVDSVSSVPTAPGQFEALVTVEPTEDGAAVLPGMACSIKLLPYENAKAVVVPAAHVFTEGDERIVYVRKGDTNERRVVKVGKNAGKLLEILEGLAAGEEILQKKPQ